MTAEARMQLDVHSRSNTVRYQTQTEMIQWYPSTSYICIYNNLPQAPRLSQQAEALRPFYVSLSYQERIYKDMTLLSAGLVVSGT
jgi:hypothetical protein